MPTPPAVIRPGIWITMLVLAALVVGVIAVGRIDPWGKEGNRLSDRFDYELTDYKTIDPALLQYREIHAFPVGLKRPRAVAVGPDDRIYVAGDQAIVAFEPEGAKAAQIDLEGVPWCLAVAATDDGPLVHVGMKEHVEVYSVSGRRLSIWPTLGTKAILTSIAVGESDVFLADAGNRIVWHCDRSGKVLKSIGKRDEDRHIRGFVIPSPYFDLALSSDGLVRVVNPGAHRVEGYTLDGDLEVVWGKPSLAIDGFCGCCNPANFAILPDGGFVTAEKGLPRVKVYDSEGRLAAVVAGPEQLAATATITEETREAYKLDVLDVAADRQGRVVLLDPTAKCVRVFERAGSSAQKKTEARDE